MQYGFTSGSCAAAAAKAAVYMLLSGRRKTEITIETPKGIPYHAKVEHIKIQETEVSDFFLGLCTISCIFAN